MKYLFPILALFIVLRPFSPYVEYVLNYEYISEVLCINKDKPKLECNGKCYLMQSLAEASDETGDPTEIPSKKLDFQLLYFTENRASSKVLDFEFKSRLHINTNSIESYKFLIAGQVFRPPIS